MSDNAEEGIARAQTAAMKQQGGGAPDIARQQASGSRYINERIVTFVIAIAAFVLIGIWATTDSVLIVHGSMILVVLLIFAWGILRIRAINRLREQRRQQAADWNRGEH